MRPKICVLKVVAPQRLTPTKIVSTMATAAVRGILRLASQETAGESAKAMTAARDNGMSTSRPYITAAKISAEVKRTDATADTFRKGRTEADACRPGL